MSGERTDNVVALPGATNPTEPEATVTAIPPKASPQPPAADMEPAAAIAELRSLLAQPDVKLLEQRARLLSIGQATKLDLQLKLSTPRLVKRWRKVPELAPEAAAPQPPPAEPKAAEATAPKPTPTPTPEPKAPEPKPKAKAKLTVHKLSDEERTRLRESAKEQIAKRIQATARRKAVRRRLDEIGRALIGVASRNECLLSLQIDPEDPKEPICLGIYEWEQPEGGKGEPKAVLLVEAHGADLGGCLANAMRAFKRLDEDEPPEGEEAP